MTKLQPARSKECLVLVLGSLLKREGMNNSFLLPPSYCLDFAITAMKRCWWGKGKSLWNLSRFAFENEHWLNILPENGLWGNLEAR